MKYNVLSISVSGNIDKVQAVRRLVAKSLSPASRWPRLQELKEVYMATRPHITERFC